LITTLMKQRVSHPPRKLGNLLVDPARRSIKLEMGSSITNKNAKRSLNLRAMLSLNVSVRIPLMTVAL